jgi:hypothetical protein
MAIGDFTLLIKSSTQGGRGGRLYNVAAGTPILAGEPVQKLAVGDVAVIPGRTSTPIVGTSPVEGLFVGIATTNSTNTTTTAGTVNVIPVRNTDTWLVAPAVAATYGLGSTPVQATYDALVGKRVLIQNGATNLSYVANVNTGTYSVLASDSASNGVIVQAKSVLEYPGKVAVSFRNGVSDLS